LSVVNQPIAMDEQWIDTTWRGPLTQQINVKWPDAPRKAFLMGNLIAQIAYSAATLKDAGVDTQFRGAMTSLLPRAGMGAKMRADITALQNIPFAAKAASGKTLTVLLRPRRSI
jgi:hypothetical protein